MSKGPEQVRRTKGPRYTPVSKRQDKPDGIAWIIRNHPEITDGQIGVLIGTTRTTIQAIRERSHWRSEEHTSELQSLMRISYAVFCLNKNKSRTLQTTSELKARNTEDTTDELYELITNSYTSVVLHNQKKNK